MIDIIPPGNMYAYDALLVLGCGINDRGELNTVAQASVETAKHLWEDQVAPLLIMSGRVSYRADFEPPISEAQAMKEYSIALGMPADAVLTEVESKDTLGNAVFTRLNILGPLALRRILIVPGPNHSAERLRYIFRKTYGKTIAYSFTPSSDDRPQEQDREEKSLQVLQEWLDDVDDGDVMAVYRVMRLKHPGYTAANFDMAHD